MLTCAVNCKMTLGCENAKMTESKKKNNKKKKKKKNMYIYIYCQLQLQPCWFEFWPGLLLKMFMRGGKAKKEAFRCQCQPKIVLEMTFGGES